MVRWMASVRARTAIVRYVILCGSRRVYALLTAPGHELARVAVVASDRFGGCVPVCNVQSQERAEGRHYVGCGQCYVVIACLPCAFRGSLVQYGQ
jgi:hypothetical protein